MMRLSKRSRGVSLIEALVAMAVMAFGMLGVVGLQATLRANADLSKQRSEAVRIAQETIEQWRSFSVLDATAGHTLTYAGIASLAAADVAGYTTNTTYTRTGTVTESAPPGHKTLVVNVTWADRAGAGQNVRLFSTVAQLAPEFSATLVAPPTGGQLRRPQGRSRGIPPQAKNFGDGSSGFVPPQPPGGTVAWLFNNSTGVISAICESAVAVNNSLVRTDFINCVTTTPHLLMSGFLRFDTRAVQPTAADIVNQTESAVISTVRARVVQVLPTAGTRTCFHEAGPPVSLPLPAAPLHYLQYFCAVPVAAPALSWTGSLEIDPTTLALAPNLASNSATAYKVCRYRAQADYSAPAVTISQLNENLVIIRAGIGSGAAFTCPAGVTWPHQPAT